MTTWPDIATAELTAAERADLLACPDWILRALGAKVDQAISTRQTMNQLAYEARIPWYAHHHRAIARLRAALAELPPA